MKCFSRFFSPLIPGPVELHLSCETPLKETRMQATSHLQRLEKIDDFTACPSCHVYLPSAFRLHHQKLFYYSWHGEVRGGNSDFKTLCAFLTLIKHGCQLWVDHRSGHLISMSHIHLNSLSSQSKPKKRCSQRYWDLSFYSHRNNDMICLLALTNLTSWVISIYLVYCISPPQSQYFSLSLTHDLTQMKQSVLCWQNPDPQSSRFTSCSLTWITSFPELYKH